MLAHTTRIFVRNVKSYIELLRRKNVPSVNKYKDGMSLAKLKESCSHVHRGVECVLQRSISFDAAIELDI